LTDVGVTFPTPTFIVPKVALVVLPRFVPVTIKGPVGPKSETLVICCASAREAMHTVSANARASLMLKLFSLDRVRRPLPDTRTIAAGRRRFAKFL
jgi:hypothetical protein